MRRRRGPCLVLKKLGDVTYTIAKSRDATVTVHSDHLLPYRGPRKPRWMKAFEKDVKRRTENKSTSVSCDTDDLNDISTTI